MKYVIGKYFPIAKHSNRKKSLYFATLDFNSNFYYDLKLDEEYNAIFDSQKEANAFIKKCNMHLAFVILADEALKNKDSFIR